MSCIGTKGEWSYPVGRVEEAYLLVDTPSENVQAVPDEVAGVALPYFRHVLVVDLPSFQAVAVDLEHSLFGHSRVVSTVDQQFSLMDDCRMPPSLAGIAGTPWPLCPLQLLELRALLNALHGFEFNKVNKKNNTPSHLTLLLLIGQSLINHI